MLETSYYMMQPVVFVVSDIIMFGLTRVILIVQWSSGFAVCLSMPFYYTDFCILIHVKLQGMYKVICTKSSSCHKDYARIQF